MSDTDSPHDRVVMYADGGSRGNPGPAGYGSVVLAPDGTVLAERAASLGRVTNNVAEYSGLIAGLEAARELGASRVDVRMDSKLVVEQMSGRWQVKHRDMKPLARKASGLVRDFEKVTFEWVPRAQNTHADRLANEAMDAAREGRAWVQSVGGDRASNGDRHADADSQTRTDSPNSPNSPNSPGRASNAVVERAAPPAVRDGKQDRAPALDLDATVDTAPTAQDPAAALPFTRTGATKFLLVRHGETTWGAEARFAGREDVPLTARGARQAEAVAARIRPLAPSIVLTSPLQRCRTTAEAIAGAARVRVVVEDRLNDGLLGEWTGFRAAEIAQRWPAEFAAWRSDPDAEPPGGESFTGIRERVRPVLNETVEAFRGHTVVLVTHAATSKMILATALNVESAMGYRVRVDTASLTGFTVEPDGTVLVWVVNDTGHLTGPIAEPVAR